jgi:hypothetical protein
MTLYQKDGCTKSDRNRCKEDGCTSWSRGASGLCVKHGGGKRCTEDGCTKGAQGATDFCVQHGGGKRCEEDGCTKSAEGATSLCVQHGGGKRCKENGCTKGAKGATDLCVQHGGGKRCKESGCTKGAKGATNFCIQHGGGLRCALCTQVSVKYQGFYCYQCRVGTARFKQFEAMVEEFLKSNSTLSLYSYRDEVLPCSPNRRRGDFVYILSDRVVILEVDEYQHRYYNKECECIRVLELHEQGRGLPLFLVRFNPKKSLLGNLARLLLTCFKSSVPETLLEVFFLGYSSECEYDIVKELVKLTKDRGLNSNILT